ncbi:putative la-type HTH domain, winged helix-like DNA-binding domain superfamily [Helianthus annuus]|nr:putative la-type HTH domain, winged helix-like DNA-binding domain superfamily [Helianthus annuus]
MDEEGWVPVSFVAGFNKVLCLTDNVQLRLDVMQQSTVVEVQGNKMTRRDYWVRWLMPPGVQDSLGRHSQPGGGDPPPMA